MFELYNLSRLEKIIVDALDLGIYDTKNYKIDKDITYVSIKYDNLSIAGAFRNKECVVVKVCLFQGNEKIPVFGGKEGNPNSREWITNEKKLRKKTLETINKIVTKINIKKPRQSLILNRAV